MPLSEQEQKILDEIAKKLNESDPQFVRLVGKKKSYQRTLRGSKWPGLLCVLGFFLMIGLLTVHYLAAFVGFLVMALGAFFLESSFRKFGQIDMNNTSADPYRPKHGSRKEDETN